MSGPRRDQVILFLGYLVQYGNSTLTQGTSEAENDQFAVSTLSLKDLDRRNVDSLTVRHLSWPKTGSNSTASVVLEAEFVPEFAVRGLSPWTKPALLHCFLSKY